jgi:hypothetical protein
MILGPRLQLIADLMADPDLMTTDDLREVLRILTDLSDDCEEILIARGVDI